MSDNYDWEEWNESATTFRQHVLAGCVAGVSEHIVFFPIDTVRVCAIPTFDHHSIRSEGLRVLWRGMSMTITACIPAHALYFSIYEYTKRKLGGNDNKHILFASFSNSFSFTSLHANASAIGGALASVAHDAVMTPLDVVKQRMQLGLYSSPMTALRSIIRYEGFRALYSSYFTTILMNVPNAAVLVVTNDWMKSILNPSGKQNFSAFLVSGLVAGSLSGFVTCPLDVIKTRIQTQTTGADGVLRRYTGFWQTLKLLVKEEGVRSLFMGVSTRIMQQAPAAALSWTVYETVKRLLV
ncbi:Mitoferrin (Mrs3/Mrs4) [Blastocystis hominis]|uniref:Mitoferrin (Mrs3/Mrs4) n=1 Tax=Blastocystis hominis TaxID=12968 RepID=D8M2H3_BLAHO|nr:Mitoferrin (Mrs3/Mrs4) [Blastocystis hominis]CBK22262.2 Mitoferrin (Mrs3/Mrs4) [Blastocystis hominis]|eukprot:XP_012896310.1 Mitoferrin (Mrs3/Mrs4) [Blastocystis hominis]